MQENQLEVSQLKHWNMDEKGAKYQPNFHLRTEELN